MTTTSKVYGSTPEVMQDVSIEFEYYRITKWFGEGCTVFVNYCKIKEQLYFKPTDLQVDLGLSIANALGEEPEDIRIECDVLYTQIKTSNLKAA
jgi:hypothetical protein